MRKLLAVLAVLLTLTGRAQALTNFPSLLDDNSTLFNLVNGDVYIAQMHNNPKDAILALQAKVGVDGSAVTTSLDYLVKNTASVDPGHTHTGTSTTFADGSAASPGLRFGTPVTDTNTGLFHPGVGVIAVASAGVEVTRVSGTGVGIFTTPFFPLDVAGEVRIQGSNFLCFGGTGAADDDTCLSRSGVAVVTLAGAFVATDQATTATSLRLNGIAAKTGNFIDVRLLAADANPSFRLAADGVTLGWGAGGASAIDTTLTRSGANALTASGALVVTGNLTVSGTGTTTIGGAGATITIAGSGAAVTNLGVGGTGTVNLGNSTGDVTIPDNVDFILNTGTGTRIGTATTQKIGFYNTTPVVQPTAATALVTALQNLGLIAAGTFSGNIVTTGTLTVGTSGTAITRHLSGSATLDFANVAAGPECSADLTITVTNAASGDRCDLGVPTGVPAKSVFFCHVSGANTVTVRHCCLTGACDPASATYRAGVWQ